MEPITAIALIAAFSAGITGGLTEVGKQAIIQGYEALKSLIKKKFGEQSHVFQDIERLEADPSSEASKALVKETVAKAQADQDPEIHQLAQSLLDQLKGLPSGKQHVQNAIGSYIAQASESSTASVNVNQPHQTNS